MGSLESGLQIVTGASSGIGRSLARRLAASGAPVALLARRLELLRELAAEIERAGGRALALGCDVTDRAAVAEAVRAAEAWAGPTARLIANAGGTAGKARAVFDPDQLRRCIELNLMGTSHSIEAVLPGMLERRRGHLVATSSLAAARGLPGSAAYSAAKAALTTFLESLRLELRGTGVEVTVIAPGFVRTAPGKKRNRPLVVELEPATDRMHRAIVAGKPYYAFPPSLVAATWLLRALPGSVYPRLAAALVPRPKAAAGE